MLDFLVRGCLLSPSVQIAVSSAGFQRYDRLSIADRQSLVLRANSAIGGELLRFHPPLRSAVGAGDTQRLQSERRASHSQASTSGGSSSKAAADPPQNGMYGAPQAAGPDLAHVQHPGRAADSVGQDSRRTVDPNNSDSSSGFEALGLPAELGTSEADVAEPVSPSEDELAATEEDATSSSSGQARVFHGVFHGTRGHHHLRLLLHHPSSASTASKCSAYRLCQLHARAIPDTSGSHMGRVVYCRQRRRVAPSIGRSLLPRTSSPSLGRSWSCCSRRCCMESSARTPGMRCGTTGSQPVPSATLWGEQGRLTPLMACWLLCHLLWKTCDEGAGCESLPQTLQSTWSQNWSTVGQRCWSSALHGVKVLDRRAACSVGGEAGAAGEVCRQRGHRLGHRV